jgi:hypothetical protein
MLNTKAAHCNENVKGGMSYTNSNKYCFLVCSKTVDDLKHKECKMLKVNMKHTTKNNELSLQQTCKTY